MSALSAISKGRKNTQQGYAFRGIDDAMNALHGPLSAAGVFYTAAVRDVVKTEFTTTKGTAMLHFTLTVAYTFHAADGSSVTFEAVGEASDSGDKAAGKAQSYALKVALIQVFCIPTEEQKDTEYASPERAAPTMASQPAPAFSSSQLRTWKADLAAVKSRIELREKWNSLPREAHALLKQEATDAAERIDAAILPA